MQPHEEPTVTDDLIAALGADALRALEAVRFPIGLVDLERRVRWQNAASIELIGDVRGRLDASHVAPESLGPAREQFARKVLGAAHTEHEVTVVCVDGTHARIDTSSVPIKGPEGIVGVLAIGRVVQREVPRSSVPRLTPRERQTRGGRER